MQIQLFENEKIVYESRASSASGAFGGMLTLTNQRLISETGVLESSRKLDTEIPLNEITGYRKAFIVGVGTLATPIPNGLSIITKTNIHKFALTINSMKIWFSYIADTVPHAELLPNEKYTESLKNFRSSVVSTIQGKKVAINNKAVNNSPTNTTESVILLCPECNSKNLKTSKFCNSCGEKLQLEYPNCNAPIEEGKKFCAECGMPIKRKNECSKCGAVFSKEQNCQPYTGIRQLYCKPFGWRVQSVRFGIAGNFHSLCLHQMSGKVILSQNQV